jgi:hypothetical protein
MLSLILHFKTGIGVDVRFISGMVCCCGTILDKNRVFWHRYTYTPYYTISLDGLSTHVRLQSAAQDIQTLVYGLQMSGARKKTA